MYTKDLVFENNWNIESPSRTVGIGSYVLAVVKARFYIHSRYAKVKVSVISCTIDETLGCVQLQWRVSGLPQVKAFMFWKFRPFHVKAKAEVESEWLEGLSTFYVNNKGFVNRHVICRVIPQDNKSNKNKKTGLGLEATS
jgi:hypothetical protein